MARTLRYRIYGKYKGCDWEKIDDASTKRKVYDLLEEYRLAYGDGWKFQIRYGNERLEA